MTQEGGALPSMTERAEQVLTFAGGQLGTLAGRAALRFRQAAQAFHEEAEPEAPPAPQQATETMAEQNGRAEQTSMERAEVLVDQLGQRIGHWAAGSNLYMKRAVARLREDAEDIVVEAQEMRKAWQGKLK